VRVKRREIEEVESRPHPAEFLLEAGG
jgi:hypothetical protein